MRSYKFKRWLLLFSHSGFEAAQLVSGLDTQFPSRFIEVWTNQKKPEKYEQNFSEIKNVSFFPLTPEVMHAELANINEPALVTLHGYNRILPESVVNNKNLEIYNMHPGDIISHPDLKGKDPQERALARGYEHTGVVLHRVTNELDGGPMYGYIRYDIVERDLLTVVNDLREESLNLWFPFLIKKLGEKE